MQKTVSILLAICLSFTLLPLHPVAYATTVQPRWNYTSYLYSELSFEGDYAVCDGVVTPSAFDDAYIVLRLFRQNGAGWTLVAYWEGSATGGDFAHAGGRVYVGSGTFQMTVWCNIGDKEFPSDSVIKTN